MVANSLSCRHRHICRHRLVDLISRKDSETNGGTSQSESNLALTACGKTGRQPGAPCSPSSHPLSNNWQAVQSQSSTILIKPSLTHTSLRCSPIESRSFRLRQPVYQGQRSGRDSSRAHIQLYRQVYEIICTKLTSHVEMQSHH